MPTAVAPERSKAKTPIAIHVAASTADDAPNASTTRRKAGTRRARRVVASAPRYSARSAATRSRTCSPLRTARMLATPDGRKMNGPRRARAALGSVSMDPAQLRSVNFDRAAEFYDATRDAGDEIVGWTVDVLARELDGRGRALEIGVGTGAIALPLTARDIDLVGMDVSTAMMAKLLHKAGGRAPLPLVQGDAARIPVRDGSLAGAYARHVFHLIADWRTAVAELCRVVGDGVVLIDVGGFPNETWLELWDAMQLGPEAEPVGLDV